MLVEIYRCLAPYGKMEAKSSSQNHSLGVP